MDAISPDVFARDEASINIASRPAAYLHPLYTQFLKHVLAHSPWYKGLFIVHTSSDGEWLSHPWEAYESITVGQSRDSNRFVRS